MSFTFDFVPSLWRRILYSLWLAYSYKNDMYRFARYWLRYEPIDKPLSKLSISRYTRFTSCLLATLQHLTQPVYSYVVIQLLLNTLYADPADFVTFLFICVPDRFPVIFSMQNLLPDAVDNRFNCRFKHFILFVLYNFAKQTLRGMCVFRQEGNYIAPANFAF